MSDGGVFVLPGSRVRRFAETLSWLWRLGPVCDLPERTLVGFGWQNEAAELHRLLRDGSLAGAVVFATRPGPPEGPMPSRARRIGIASFGPGQRVAGQFPVLDGDGEAVARSSLGVHALREDAWMVLGADPEVSWGALDGFWAFETLAAFMVDVLDRPLAMLPAVGWARYDDVPGTAHQQLMGRDKPDRRVRRRIEDAVDRFAAVDACLNIAVTPRALRDGQEVWVEEIWPEAIAAIESGVRKGCLEPVCHGYLHLDTEAWAGGRKSAREFADVDREEAGRRLDISLDWFASSFGAGRRTFVAPAWAYSEGLLAALAERQVPAWLPPDPGPLVLANAVRETVLSTMEGMVGLDYGPLGALAGAGVPPSLVFHGGLFDPRAALFRDPRQILTTARLIRRRDLFRAPWVDGVRWIGAAELVDRLRAHDRVQVNGTSVSGPAGTELVVRDRAGSHITVIGADRRRSPS